MCTLNLSLIRKLKAILLFQRVVLSIDLFFLWLKSSLMVFLLVELRVTLAPE